MALIKPFCAVRYNTEKAGKLDDLVTPPYDVIQKNAEQALWSRNPFNIIRLDLTKNPGQEKNANSGRFSDAASLLNSWLKEGILVRDSTPSLYPYDVEYKMADGSLRTRKGFICLVALTDFSEQSVKPHEQTFDTVIQDRLELTRKCRAQFSQVFSTFSDPDNRSIAVLDRVKGEPIARITDADGCQHILWQVTNENAIATVQNVLAQNAIYIADGHHRYTTALAYRNERRKEVKQFSSDAPENQITMYLCPMEDVGLSILPVHRLIRYPGALALTVLLKQLDNLFQVQEISGGSREALIGELNSLMAEQQKERLVGEPISLGFYHPGEDRCFLLTIKNRALQKLETYHSSLRDIDAVILTGLVIEDILKLNNAQCEHDSLISFHSDIAEALDISVKESSIENDQTPLLFVLNPTTIGQVKSVSDAGLFMPHKSTYFYPKVVTGLVMNVFGEAGVDAGTAE